MKNLNNGKVKKYATNVEKNKTIKVAIFEKKKSIVSLEENVEDSPAYL